MRLVTSTERPEIPPSLQFFSLAPSSLSVAPSAMAVPVLAIAFAKDAWWLDIGRLLIGLGVGLLTYVVPVYVAEITPKSLRGRFTSANQMLTSCGFAFSYCIGNIISWRTLALLGSIPCLLQLLGLFFIPESPRWLAKRGREKEFEASLQHLWGKNADVSVETMDIRDIIESFQHNSEGNALDLFQRRYCYSIIVGVGLMLLQQFGGNSGVVYYSSTIFAEADFSTILGTTALAIILLVAATVSLLLMDIFGRRTLLMVSSGGTCLFLCLVGLSFLLKEHGYLKELTPFMAFAGLLGYLAAFGVGISGIPWVIMSEAGHSSPAEAGIMEDPYMSVASYSIFGSVITIGGVIGSIVNGKMADLIGRRLVGSSFTL
ncbi:hypothetical protein GH714_003607 [Hevea brasiliensis]|uniref:Major facilitator superfamily (MFS) profile domain-containing protein n=1 Tax=Hevea brasiliensis TaxID=3981 RepID=A0A6A6KIJ8_HEVBR|nr:hypothetical protein GH714_003607 [Hevea brasiliensis]